MIFPQEYYSIIIIIIIIIINSFQYYLGQLLPNLNNYLLISLN
jgi:hypothetical protein